MIDNKIYVHSMRAPVAYTGPHGPTQLLPWTYSVAFVNTSVAPVAYHNVDAAAPVAGEDRACEGEDRQSSAAQWKTTVSMRPFVALSP